MSDFSIPRQYRVEAKITVAGKNSGLTVDKIIALTDDVRAFSHTEIIQSVINNNIRLMQLYEQREDNNEEV